MSVKQLREIYQIKISLIGAKPPIWRTVLVDSHVTLDELHEIIQLSMGWSDSHLHQFIANEKSYGFIDEDLDLDLDLDLDFEMKDESQFKLSQLLTNEKDSLIYEYDFGDSWEHQVLLEKILPFDTKISLPVCIKGKRACPPEDCGGIWGYEELLEVISNPKNPEYEEMLEWLDEDFDPEAFVLEDVNESFRKYL
jgi:hypothetical protein